jgi:hypothetical protein
VWRQETPLFQEVSQPFGHPPSRHPCREGGPIDLFMDNIKKLLPISFLWIDGQIIDFAYG